MRLELLLVGIPAGNLTGQYLRGRIAVDSDGKTIEQIPGDCGTGCSWPVRTPVGQWHFSPIVENGKQVRYRAEILFRRP